MLAACAGEGQTEKLKKQYSYSRSYVVKAGATKKFKVAEKVYTKMFTGSYKDDAGQTTCLSDARHTPQRCRKKTATICLNKVANGSVGGCGLLAKLGEYS